MSTANAGCKFGDLVPEARNFCVFGFELDISIWVFGASGSVLALGGMVGVFGAMAATMVGLSEVWTALELRSPLLFHKA